MHESEGGVREEMRVAPNCELGLFGFSVASFTVHMQPLPGPTSLAIRAQRRP
jgi:hypothetical protein